MLQCDHLASSGNSATRAVCAHISDVSMHLNSTLPSTFDSLATLLSSELNHFEVCLKKSPSMKKLLLAISATDSHDPRDPTATATNLLNICFSPDCYDVSTATLLAVAAESVGWSNVSHFCTSPVTALLWKHAIVSRRECSDSMITIISAKLFMTPCALRSLLATYVAVCDAKAIQCEEAYLAADADKSNDCESTIRHNQSCSSECAALAHEFSSGPRCLENVLSNQQVLAYVINETCSDDRSKLENLY